MIDGKRIDKKHNQNKKPTCLMSNYAVASNYFTGIDIEEYFIDYLKEFENDFLDMSFFSPYFDITLFMMKARFEQVMKSNYNALVSQNFLELYAERVVNHYHIICQSKGCSFAPVKIPGLQFMKLLQENSKQHSYQCANEIIRLELYDFKNDVTKKQMNQNLNSMLNDEECILNVFSNKHRHSFTIYKDENAKEIMVHDTNMPDQDSPMPSDWMLSFDDGEVLKYVRK